MEPWTCADQIAGDARGVSRMLALCCCNLSSTIKTKIFLIFLGAEAGCYEALLSFLMKYVCNEAARSADKHNQE